MLNLNDNHYDKMASLTGLPPELRTVIYTYLLEDGLASGKRIVYCHDDEQYNDLDFSSVNEHPEDKDDTQPESEFAAWTRSRMDYERNHQDRITSLIDVRYTYGPDVLNGAIHHANIDDLLALASTCRRMRTEVLPIAWSNADITFYTPDNHFKDDIFHIFSHVLSSSTCTMIRNLHIDIGTRYWSASDVSETAYFIMKHLPNLKDLHVSVASENIEVDLPEFYYGLCALTALPYQIMVEVTTYMHPSAAKLFDQTDVQLIDSDDHVTISNVEHWERVMNLKDMFHFECARQVTQFARALRAQNEERHLDGSLLEDTLGLRSGMAGWPIVARHTIPKERWEVRREGRWRDGWKVKESVENTIKVERELSLGPWSDKNINILSEGASQDNIN
ncbi:hypothetical protein KCU93_g5009, partial [Aureobasidium melanogenum]